MITENDGVTLSPDAARAVREWLRPLQTGPYPPLVLEDLRPNIEV